MNNENESRHVGNNVKTVQIRFSQMSKEVLVSSLNRGLTVSKAIVGGFESVPNDSLPPEIQKALSVAQEQMEIEELLIKMIETAFEEGGEIVLDTQLCENCREGVLGAGLADVILPEGHVLVADENPTYAKVKDLHRTIQANGGTSAYAEKIKEKLFRGGGFGWPKAQA